MSEKICSRKYYFKNKSNNIVKLQKTQRLIKEISHQQKVFI